MEVIIWHHPWPILKANIFLFQWKNVENNLSDEVSGSSWVWKVAARRLVSDLSLWHWRVARWASVTILPFHPNRPMLWVQLKLIVFFLVQSVSVSWWLEVKRLSEFSNNNSSLLRNRNSNINHTHTFLQ